MTPQRIQRTRQHPMPTGSIYVGRPTPFGNPWRAINFGTAREPLWAVVGPTRFVPRVKDETSRASAHELAVDMYRKWLDDWVFDWAAEQYDRYAHARERILNHLPELHGHNLACWCPPEYACHSLVLLELANPEDTAA